MTQIDNVILQQGITTLVTILIYSLSQLIINRLIRRRSVDSNQKFQLQKTFEAILRIFLVVIIWQIWLPGIESTGTFLGLLSAGIAIALKDLIASLFGWFFITWQKPFEVGDRIQVGEINGDVIDQRMFSFLLIEVGNWVDADQSTGRVIFIPNSKVFVEPLFGYTKGIGGYIWNEIPVILTFESDWEKGKQELRKILDQYSNDNPIDIDRLARNQKQENFLIHPPSTSPIVYTSIVENGVLLTMRFLCKPRQRRIVSELIWEATLSLINQNVDINLAYSTQRVIVDHSE